MLAFRADLSGRVGDLVLRILATVRPIYPAIDEPRSGEPQTSGNTSFGTMIRPQARSPNEERGCPPRLEAWDTVLTATRCIGADRHGNLMIKLSPRDRLAYRRLP